MTETYLHACDDYHKTQESKVVTFSSQMKDLD